MAPGLEERSEGHEPFCPASSMVLLLLQLPWSKAPPTECKELAVEPRLVLTEPCLPLWNGKSERWVRGEVGEARLSMDFRAAGFEYMVAAGSKRMQQGTGLTTRPLRMATGRPALLSM